jgi:nitroreductase
MLHRQPFTPLSTATAGSSAVAQAAPADTSYAAAASQIWRHTDSPLTRGIALQRELVRYATLAASSHNTQCWKFRLEGDRISILPDLERRTPVVDPDDHHLYASLGCATENLLQAALAHGLQGLVDVTADGTIQIDLEPTQAIASPLFKAIPQRQSTRAEYDGQPLQCWRATAASSRPPLATASICCC